MWSARTSDLQEAVRILNLVSSKTGTQSSDFFKVEPLSDAGVLSFSTAASAVAEVQIEGSGKWPYKKPLYLERKTFAPFINYPTEVKNKNPFTFSDENYLIVRHGERKAEFPSQPTVGGYADFPQNGKMNKLALTKEVSELMICAGSCAASELQAPHLACVYMLPIGTESLRLFATNLKVVFSAKVNLRTSITEALPFPLGMLDILKADGLKSLRWMNKLVAAWFQLGVVWQPVSELAKKDFPVSDILNSLKASRREELLVFEMSAYKFAKMMERLAYYLQGVRQEDWVLKLRGKRGSDNLEVTAELTQVRFREVMEARTMKDFSFDWPLFMIEPVMRIIGKEQEKVTLKVSLEKSGMRSHLKCGNIEMVIPSKAI
jgi:hypothetical protein